MSESQPGQQKVFGIGFHRTGTKSLNKYLEHLGLRSAHWISKVGSIRYESLTIPHLNDRDRVLDILAPAIDQFDAVTDVPIPGLYSELDRRYPDSKFIMVTRQFGTWWPSLKAHWRLQWRHFKALDPYEYQQYNRYTDREIHYLSLGDRELVLDLHRAHKRGVRKYFRSRPNQLLWVELEDPEIGQKISNFLGRTGGGDFPHVGAREIESPAETP